LLCASRSLVSTGMSISVESRSQSAFAAGGEAVIET
jgi:hypothetical protein